MKQHRPPNDADFLGSCRNLIAKRHPACSAAFINREASPWEKKSRTHIKMLVLYPKITVPLHEYDTLGDWSFEAFVHDEETLDRALRERDFVSGVPFYSRLILEGRYLFKQMWLDTAQPATDLVAFYQRHGFKIDRQTWYVGKTYTSWVMRRELEPIATSASASRA